MSSTSTVSLDFQHLTPYQSRRFVPDGADLTDLKQVTDLYQKLEARPINSGAELEGWILDRSEVDAVLDQQSSILYVRMTCQTDNPQYVKAYTDFIENVTPAIKPINDRLNKKYLKERERFALDAGRYEVYDRSIRTDVSLFVEKNVPLQTKVQLLSQEYQAVCGAMTVEFEGKERTLPEMAKYLLETDRGLRERAWQATAARRLRDREKLDDIFDQMLRLRHEIALNAGFANFRDYKFKSYHRFDYTPEDCKRYHRSMEKLVLPLYRDIMKKRKEQMTLSTLKPWDTAVDPFGRPALKPFNTVDELLDRSHNIFEKTDEALGSQFGLMRQLGLLDLASRKGKAPGGYQSTMAEARKPFIFMNAVGVDGDVRTLLHEAGHAFHALACAADPIVDYRHAPMEFAEVASMAMELLAEKHLDQFYSAEDKKRSVAEHLEDIIHVLVWVANVDAFQHWMYENPQHTREERTSKWTELYDRFGGDLIDWSGLEHVKSYLWHRQLHIFEVPFYYIEYGIAQLGALQIWMQAKTNPVQALANYRKGLALGGSRPLPELYAAAGIRFDFSEEIIGPLAAEVKKEWEGLVE